MEKIRILIQNMGINLKIKIFLETTTIGQFINSNGITFGVVGLISILSIVVCSFLIS